MLKYTKNYLIALSLTFFTQQSYSDITSINQTDETSTVYPSDSLPFTIEIKLSDFTLPEGLQNYAFALYDKKCLCITGRTNGLHGFDIGDNNFPPREQNTKVFVIDLETKKTYFKSLRDQSSGLSTSEIDSLSATATQFSQTGNTLYVVGGYGVDTPSGLFSTKSTLSAINIPGLIHWVQKPSKGESAKQHIRQISHPIFQITGGTLLQANPHEPFLLIFGQNFDGFYTSGSNGLYTEQIRTFKLIDDGTNLALFSEKFKAPSPNYRRRDLNTVPIIQKSGTTYKESFVALSGVFTLAGGIWTVPVFINAKGESFMPNPANENTFKQSMNNYNSAHIGLFSKKSNQMHTIILGGLSYQTYADGVFSQDEEVPFTNNVTDIVIDSKGNMNQYLMNADYPVIPSVFSNPGNTLLFGTGANFIPVNNLSSFSNSVFSLDSLKKRTLLGYIIGGIMSTLPNTTSQADSAASPYIFEVYATPQ